MKRFFARLLPIVLLLTLFSCGNEPEMQDDTLVIATTTYPIYLFTTAVTEGVEGVEVRLIVNEQVSCLHDYTLTVQAMKVIEKADVLVLNGAGLEDFMEDALAASDAAVIDCSERVALLPADGHEGHTHAEGEVGHDDPHIWLSQEAAALMLRSVADGLCALDAAHSELYEQNYETAVAQLTADPLAGVAWNCPYLITFHDGFAYLAQSTGLTLLRSIEEEEGSEASAADIRAIIALIEEYNIPAIFTETNGSDSTAQAIARETGVAVYQLDTIMSGDGVGIEAYVDAMNANYATILQALGGN